MTDIPASLQNVAQKVPGYTGYQSKERRRDADKILRERLAASYAQERSPLVRLAQSASHGHLEYSDRIEKISQGLERFISRLQLGPRGYAGWFDAAQIQEADLDQLYQFDSKLADGVDELRQLIGQANTALQSGPSAGPALDALRDYVDSLNSRLDARQEFIAIGKRPSPSASPLGALNAVVSTKPNAFEQLKLNDAVSYAGQDYLVSGHISYNISSASFQAFLLDDRAIKKWLRVGPNQELAVLDEVPFAVPSPLPDSLSYQGAAYSRAEQGAANVTVEGAGGARTGAVNYSRYTGDGGKRLWIEDWGTETRVQVGSVVDPFELKLYRKL